MNYLENKIGEKVKEFYNETPFPDFDLELFKTKEDLLKTKYPFPKILKRSVPDGSSLIDVGCGTGQLANYMALRGVKAVGIDFSDGSLKKAVALEKKLQTGATFYKADILKDDLSFLGSFDYVLSLGVLHHTGDAKMAFKNITSLMKDNGKIGIGLYNTYGRCIHQIRVKLANTVFKNNQKIKDYFIKLQIGSLEDKERVRGWWNDQYVHPHETSHTIQEVFDWFDECGITYTSSVPPLLWDGIWDTRKRPRNIKVILKQLIWVLTTHKDGGYWITFGKK